MIAVATPGDVPAAVRRLLPPPRADRLLNLLAAGAVSADHLLVARRGGRVVGAAFAETAGDGLAGVRPPAADDPATADALAAALLDRLRAAGVVVVQCLLPPAEVAAAGPLVRCGFRHVTRLVTLRRPLAGLAPVSSPLGFEPADRDPAGFVAAFAASLTGSLDLPELAGLRTPEVELAGYPATHRLLARLAGDPVGVLLLAADEVLYLGLVPAARGRGFGHALVRRAFSELSAAGATATSVSADVRNVPAVRLYERSGFQACGSQEVLLWTAAG